MLAKAAGGKVPVRVFNLSGSVVKLMPRSRVATVYKPQEVLSKEFVEFEEKEAMLHVKALW